MLSATETRTTCAYCGVGCGLVATVRPSGEVSIRGDDSHPGSLGRLCVKGATLGETLGLEGRLLRPMVRGVESTWDAALAHVSGELARIARESGPESVALYLSGQLLTEDYYVANKLGKGFLRTPHVDTNSRLCMAASVAAYKHALGGDLVPTCYDDLDHADLFVLAGSNAAICHPVLFERIEARRAASGASIVALDPRRTETAERADLYLPLRPGTDAYLWKGLLAFLDRRGAIDRAFVEQHTTGLADALAAAASLSEPSIVARVCDVPRRDVVAFYELFAAHRRVITAHSQGVHQSARGTDKVRAIVECHLARGAIGELGSGPLSLTGQVNAMGGREVGGLATTLAAHMGYDEASRERVARFWRSPGVPPGPGKTAVEIFEAIERGEIRAIWIACTNPLASLPDADRARRALARCELVIVSEITAETETAALAHVLLPAAAWGEKDGTITTSERRIARQRAFLPVPGDARPDWWMFAEVGRRLGHAAEFAYERPRDVFVEHAALSAFENEDRVFDLRGLVDLDEAEYDALEPLQWPVGVDRRGTPRLFGDGRFATASGRAHFGVAAPEGPAEPTHAARPFALISGRVRAHWHTMTRTERVPALAEAEPEPFVEIHPDDAARLGIDHGELARIETERGAMIARARVSAKTRVGSLFVPIHWRDAVAPRGRAGPLYAAHLDPHSKQPETKHVPASIARWGATWEGFIIARGALELPHPVESSARVLGRRAVRYEIAGATAIASPATWARAIFPGPSLSWIELSDPSRGSHRFACFDDAKVVGAVYLERARERSRLPAREWLMARFSARAVRDEERLLLLVGGKVPARVARRSSSPREREHAAD